MIKSVLQFTFLNILTFSLLYGVSKVLQPSDIFSAISFLIQLCICGYLSWNLSCLLWKKLDWIPKELVSPNGKAVFITGCDSGFGHFLAKRLSQEFGFLVFAGCLFPDGEGANHLRDWCPNRIRIIKLDVTKEEDIQEMVKEVEQGLESNKLWALVNNAGILICSEVEMGDISVFNQQMNVNCLGMVRVTKALLPFLRQSPSSRIVNMASLAGRFSIPGMVAYCMSKSAVISFSEGLRREAMKWGIQVITIEPHLFRTNLCNEASLKVALEKAWNVTEPSTKVAYGNSYYEGFQRWLTVILDSARPRILDVVDTMTLAVTHQFVGTNYKVLGTLESFRVWFWSLVPGRLLDIISALVSGLYTGKPEALQGKIQNNKKCF